MPLVSIAVPPGIVRADSDLASSGRWIDMDKARFVRGKPEKLGGVDKWIETQFTGIARGAKAWNSYDGTQSLTFGTACDLYLVRNGTLYNITPWRVTSVALTDPFDVTSSSATVTVNDTAHGITSTGITVLFSGASAVGGITINGEYAVQSIPDANSFTITHSSNASSTASGGGSVSASYEINCGDVDPSYLRGWGIGGWGEGTWGTERSLSVSPVSEPRFWSLDVYGEDVVANPLNGTIYLYDTSTGTTRASAITNAPAECRSVCVTAERYIFALGCTTVAGSQDNMTVRWPDVDDNTDWTPSTTNTSNERKLQGGTRLMAGTALSEGVTLVWSDAACFLFQFTGSTEIYASRKIGDQCGLVGPYAWSKASGRSFWMGEGNFWLYSGYVEPIPNVEDVRDWVFKNLSEENQIKSFSFYNPIYNEIWFVFPRGNATEPDTYAMVDLDDFSWSTGTWDRSAATNFTTGEGRPILLGTDGYIYVHDVGEHNNVAGSAMDSFIELAPFNVDDGNRSVDIFHFIPDFERQSGDLSLYLYGRDHPRDSDFMTDTVTVTDTARKVDVRVAGRQMGMKLTSNTLGGDWRLGAPKVDVQRAGRQI